MNLRELIALGGLDDTVEDEDVTIGGRLEDEHVLVERLFNVEDLLDLEGHGLTGPKGTGLLEPAVLDERVSQSFGHCNVNVERWIVNVEKKMKIRKSGTFQNIFWWLRVSPMTSYHKKYPVEIMNFNSVQRRCLDAVLLAVGPHQGEVFTVGALLLHVLHNVGHGDNGLDRDSKVALDLLDGGQVTVLASFLTINSYEDTSQLGFAVLNDLHRLADGSASGNHIVNDKDSALERRADDRATLAVVLLLLSVEAVRGIFVVGSLGQGNDGGAGKRNTLVGRTKDDIVLDARVMDSSGVKLANLGQRGSGVEETSVKEVRADTARLEGELAKFQDLVLDSELDEITLVVLDGHN